MKFAVALLLGCAVGTLGTMWYTQPQTQTVEEPMLEVFEEPVQEPNVEVLFEKPTEEPAEELTEELEDDTTDLFQYGVHRSGSSCEGPAQGKNLGVFKSPAQCAPAAQMAGCDLFMFSKNYPSWGCRCCNRVSQKHNNWDVYRRAPQPYKLARSKMSCEGAQQGKNLGVFKTAQQCEATAYKQGCDLFMHTASYPSWGCRCCKSLGGLGKHNIWNVYQKKITAKKMKPNHSCEGKEQGKNLGVFNNPTQCAAAAAKNGCNIFMFASAAKSWGCRCCKSWTGLGAHKYWDTYATEK